MMRSSRCKPTVSEHCGWASGALVAFCVAAWPAAAASAESEPSSNALGFEVGYDNGFFIRAAEAPYSLYIGSRLQARFAYLLQEDAPDQSAFVIPRARLILGGKLFTHDLHYAFQMGFGDGPPRLVNYWIDYRFVPQWLYLRVGTMLKPFNRQAMSTSAALHFNERAFFTGAFGDIRDTGLMLHNHIRSSPQFAYALGVFNGGAGSRQSLLVPGRDLAAGQQLSEVISYAPSKLRPRLIARFGYNHGDVRGYREPDIQGGPLRFGVAVNGFFDFDADGDNESVMAGLVDAIVKVHGASLLALAYVSSRQDGPELSERTFDQWGVLGQAGYVIAERVEPVVRYARQRDAFNDGVEHEILGGLNIYFTGDHLKWQTGAGILIDSADGGTTNALLRTQVQLDF